jgi:hypothetical protein
MGGEETSCLEIANLYEATWPALQTAIHSEGLAHVFVHMRYKCNFKALCPSTFSLSRTVCNPAAHVLRTAK